MKSTFTQDQLANMTLDRLMAFAIPENKIEENLFEAIKDAQLTELDVFDLEEKIEDLEEDLEDLKEKLSNAEDELAVLADYKDFFSAMLVTLTSDSAYDDLRDAEVGDTDLTKALIKAINLGKSQTAEVN